MAQPSNKNNKNITSTFLCCSPESSVRTSSQLLINVYQRRSEVVQALNQLKADNPLPALCQQLLEKCNDKQFMLSAVKFDHIDEGIIDMNLDITTQIVANPHDIKQQPILVETALTAAIHAILIHWKSEFISKDYNDPMLHI